jgi:hypothetical protein
MDMDNSLKRRFSVVNSVGKLMCSFFRKAAALLTAIRGVFMAYKKYF